MFKKKKKKGNWGKEQGLDKRDKKNAEEVPKGQG